MIEWTNQPRKYWLQFVLWMHCLLCNKSMWNYTAVDKIQSSTWVDAHQNNIVNTEQKVYRNKNIMCIVRQSYTTLRRWTAVKNSVKVKLSCKTSMPNIHFLLFCSSFALVCLCVCVKCTVYFIWHWFISKCAHSYACKHSLPVYLSNSFAFFADTLVYTLLWTKINCSFPFSLKLSEKLVIIHRPTYTHSKHIKCLWSHLFWSR